MSWNHRTQSFVRTALHTISMCTLASCTPAASLETSSIPRVGPTAGSLASAGGAGSGANTTPAPGVTTRPGAAGSAAPITAGTGGVTTPSAAGTLPCAISTALVANCQQCHGKTPIGGAPMSLVSYEDVHAPAKTMPALKVYELAKIRLHDQAKPMPPGGKITPADLQLLDSWLGAGAQAGTAADKDCSAAMMPAPTGAGGTEDGSFGPVTAAPGETCYDLVTHQSTTSVDAAPYSVSVGEHYEQFYFKAPWPKGSVATRYGTKLDNAKVLHHWLLFSTTETNAEGYHATAPLPTLIGVNATLIAGWAVGGSNLALPSDVGFELPPTGSELNLQWHFYNSTGTQQSDRSAVQVCTVPAGARPHTATMTWIGTEDLNGNKWFGGAGMPAHMTSIFSGTCNPLRTGMNSTDPIHILGFWPHMHQLGVNMKSIINHKNGMQETIFDKAFDFNHQIHYLQNYDLMPGDTLTASCTFNNTTNQGIPFGESTDTEMCYQFTFAWPAHALENHASSLIGATNTCW